MKNSRYYLFVVCIIFASCQSVDRLIPTGENDFDFQHTSIAMNNISFIEEVSIISACQETDMVTALVLVTDREEIVCYCMGSDELKIIEVSTSNELESYELGIASQNIVISDNGQVILGATDIKESKTSTSYWAGELIGDVYVWRINDIGHPLCVDWCEPGDKEFYGYSQGISISSDGKQVIEYDSSSFILFDIDSMIRRNILLSQDADFFVSVGNISFHPNGKKYAVSFIENDGFFKGDVQVFRFSGLFSDIPNVINRNPDYESIFVKALEFSPDGKWLANITDKGINIWRVLLGKPRSISTIKNPQNLVFDANSEILFIQAENSIVVYDFRKGDIVTEIDTPGISSITISSGNEYLAWGDVEGKIHLLGIK